MAHLIFVGRENELNVLNQLLEDTKKGLGKLVFVRGEPGAGKSSLIRKFLSFHEGTLIAVAECVDKEGTNPYSPIKLILAELIAADMSDTKDEKGKILSNLKKVLSEAGPDWIAAIPVLGAFAAAGVRTFQAAREISEKPLKAADVGGENEIHKLFEDELRRLSEKRAVIVFLDDLQWTDPSTLNMLFALGRSLRAKPFPLLLIGSYRLHEFEAGKEDPRLKNRAHTFFNTLDELRTYADRKGVDRRHHPPINQRYCNG